MFLVGYSEGAYATAALMQLIESNAGLEVSAISLGSGAYNLKKTFNSYLNISEKENSCLACNTLFVRLMMTTTQWKSHYHIILRRPMQH